MGELVNLNSSAITDAAIPATIARVTQFQAADAAHIEATDPHLQYPTQARGDARYKRVGTSETFTPGNKLYAVSNYGVATETNTFPIRSGLEIQSSNGDSGAHLLFHRPGIAGVQFGLDTTNLLCVGGWSFGNSWRIWHEAFGVPVWQAPSDPKLKKGIRPIKSALSLLLEAKPICFEYKNLVGQWSESEYQRKKVHYGFDANTFPISDLVSQKDNGWLGLDYVEIIPFLVKAIQEQQEQVELLREQVELLKVDFIRGMTTTE